MRKIERAFLSEASQGSLAMLLVFLLLFVSVTLVKILSRAVAGSVPADLVMALVGFQSIRVIAVILPLAFYVGVLLALSRWYRDNEMTVLSACGVSLYAFLRPVLLLALAFGASTALFAFYLTPLAERLSDQVRQSQGTQLEPAGIAPGVFNELRKGEGFFYVEGVDRASGALTDIFVNTIEAGKEGVLVAEHGTHFTDARTGDQFLVLMGGTRYEGQPGRGDYRIIEFERYQLRIEPRAVAPGFVRYGARSTLELLAAGKSSHERLAQAEWHIRLAKPVTVFVLALFALVFAYVRPRGGRYTGMFVAVLVYFLYLNALSVGEAMIKSGRVPGTWGLWWAHGLFLLLALAALWQRANNRSLWSLPSLSRAT